MIILVWDMSLGWRHRPPRGNGSLPIENTHTHRSHDHREHCCDGEGPDELKDLHPHEEAEDEHASSAVQHLQWNKGKFRVSTRQRCRSMARPQCNDRSGVRVS